MIDHELSRADDAVNADAPASESSATKTPGAHTPGPWNIDGQFDSEISVEILSGGTSADDPKTIQICELVPFLEDWTPEEIANAHLIAAAPELLAAVKGEVCSARCAESCCGRLRAIIAKAEGRV